MVYRSADIGPCRRCTVDERALSLRDTADAAGEIVCCGADAIPLLMRRLANGTQRPQQVEVVCCGAVGDGARSYRDTAAAAGEIACSRAALETSPLVTSRVSDPRRAQLSRRHTAPCSRQRAPDDVLLHQMASDGLLLHR